MNIYPLPPTVPSPPQQNEKLWKAAESLETVFISQMLKQSGFAKPMDSFGGGIGEEQFASLMADFQAETIVKHKGFGLAEKIFNAMLENSNAK